MRDYAYESGARIGLKNLHRDMEARVRKNFKEGIMEDCEGCKWEYEDYERCFNCSRWRSDLYDAEKSGWQRWKDSGWKWPLFCPPLDCTKWLSCGSRYGVAVCFKHCIEKITYDAEVRG